MRYGYILLLLLLNACHHSTQEQTPSSIPPVHFSVLEQKDGAPIGPPPTHFVDLKPKYEAYSRYGNPDVYAVNGKKYTVMRTASGYKNQRHCFLVWYKVS